MSIREFILHLENYYGKWTSEAVFENFVHEAIKYNDTDLDRIYRLIIEVRPAKWGAPDLCCLLGVIRNKGSAEIASKDSERSEKFCPVCSWVLKMGRCDNCKYYLGEDIEGHKVWWDSYKKGERQEIRFDKEKIFKGESTDNGGCL